MRTNLSDVLNVGDRVTVTEGVYAGVEGHVLELLAVSPSIGRARLVLPCDPDYWHPFWIESMDEADWLSTRDTSAMERYLMTAGLADQRRWRLFLVGCARAIFPQLRDERFRAACLRLIETSERGADSGESLWSLASAVYQAKLAFPVVSRQVGHPEFAAGNAILRACDIGNGNSPDNWVFRQAGLNGEDVRSLLRCVFGNPFRPAVVEPAWLAWQAGLIPALAKQIHEEMRFEEMGILGDALEDAGCSDEGILGHCRSPIHTRGCCLLDAILGK